ncbi:MAG: two-component system, OmpR family, sensor histidine kinase SenX3 [Acidobacteriota bacterium]|jgi:signal transduction histidine kinase|nr:two-component system, OmpR family, sensor histidine kinase SenX3 [Acidobacteriota bacterium]
MKSRVLTHRLPIAISTVLAILLAVLAVLQWRWIGEVSAMERHRMHSSLFAAGSRFTDDFDREVTRAFLFFHYPSPEPLEPPAARLDRVIRQYDRWKAEAPYPHLVSDIFLAHPDGELEVLWPAERRFVATPWPPELAPLRKRLEAAHRPESSPGPHGLGQVVAADLPGLVIPLGFPPPPEDRHSVDQPTAQPADPLAGAHLLVRLDSRTITGELFPALTRRHFDNPRGGDYALAVEDAGDPKRIVFLSDPQVPAASFGDGDLRLDMFRLKAFDELRTLWMGREPRASRWKVAGPPSSPDPSQERMKGPPPGEHRRDEHRRDEHRREGGAWRLVIKHRDGSLEDAVTHIRRHNLAISLGILALLATTMGLMMVATQRAQRLARQQIEFVAGVTHELNTPLTAIRSAGQNLAAGVVAEPGQVKRYGDLIESEGRRLSDMVGQALELAGIQSGRRIYHPRPVEVGEIVDGALQDSRWLLQEKRIEVEKDVARDLPPVLADAAAVRRAVQNLIENAVKYGGRAAWLSVRARRGSSGSSAGVEITVADRGPGIRREDLPHLFEPFFRGRDAAAGGVPGSGLGLSLVRHIAEAHGGRITVASDEGKGSAFTLQLPAVPPAVTAAERGQPEEEPA